MFDYKVIAETDQKRLEQQINELGKLGWRVVAMAVHGQITRVIVERVAGAGN